MWYFAWLLNPDRVGTPYLYGILIAAELFNLMQALSEPWVDRTIAAVACIPLVYGAYYRMEHFHLGLPLIAAVLNTLILVVTMLIRRPPKRVTPNPWFWLLAFVASYWLVFIIFFLQKGRPVVANWITDSLATFGLAICRERESGPRS